MCPFPLHRSLTLAFALLAAVALTATATPIQPPVAPADRWNEAYAAAAADEPALEEADVLAAVNRWNRELYSARPRAALAYMWAMLLDPVTGELAETWSELIDGAATVEERVARIDAWNAEHLCHTQMQERFAELPGQDPWGVTDEGAPTFRKLLPSEMKAMERLTGRISGKCMTLANLLVSVLQRMGVPSDDLAVLHVQMPSYRHAGAFLRWDGELVRTNNHRMGMFYGEGAPRPMPPAPLSVYALYNQRWFAPVEFELTVASLEPEKLDLDRPLMPWLVEHYALSDRVPQPAPPYDVDDVEALRAGVFLNPKGDATAALAKYAYQSLYVKHPEHYLTASLQGSLTKELAATIADPPSMLRWMEENLEEGSIFPDAEGRLMTADQVLAFKTAGPKDEAVLGWTILAHQGWKGHSVTLTEDGAVLSGDGAHVDMRTHAFVEAPTEARVVLELD